MFDKIKSLGADTLIYGISTVVGRLIGFLLVPIYTHALTPSDYGIVAIAFSYIAFLNIFYSYGMESAYFRFAAKLEKGDSKTKFSTPFISLFITSILFSSIILFCNSEFANLIDINKTEIISISAGIIFFDTISIIPFASLRLEKKSKIFVSIKLVNIFSNVIFNIYTLFVLKLGLIGIFYSGLTSSIITFIFLIPQIKIDFKAKFSFSLYKELLKFGLPYIPVGISSIALQVIDRPILNSLLNTDQVGIYQSSFKLGVLMNLFTLMFEYAWRPFYLNHAKDLNIKNIISRVFSYYVFFGLTILLFFTIFISDFVTFEIFGKTIIAKNYWSGLIIVPIVLTGYFFTGCGFNFNAGIQIMKKTKSLIWTSLIAIIISLTCNFIFIPMFGISGAAISFTLGAFISSFGIFYVSQKAYPVEYEWKRIIKSILVLIILIFNYYYFEVDNIFIKIIFLTVWIATFYFLNILNIEEKSILKKYLKLVDTK